MYPRATVHVQRQISSPYLPLPIPAVTDKRLLCFLQLIPFYRDFTQPQGMKLQRNTMAAINPEPRMPPPLKDPFLSLDSGIR